MKLYVKVKKEKKDTVKTFLCKVLYNKYNGCFETFYDSKYQERECFPCYRSFEVYVYVCKTYFNVSEKKIAKTLKEIIIESNYKLSFLFCNSANKWILHEQTGNKNYQDVLIINYKDSINKTYKKGDGIYCMDDILKLINE